MFQLVWRVTCSLVVTCTLVSNLYFLCSDHVSRLHQIFTAFIIILITYLTKLNNLLHLVTNTWTCFIQSVTYLTVFFYYKSTTLHHTICNKAFQHVETLFVQGRILVRSIIYLLYRYITFIGFHSNGQ